ncbi:MAG: PEGA domain-containing protein [Myxococcales bacterium]|nr:PEGA domain-containing protein [Myxococcales bacterium]
MGATRMRLGGIVMVMICAAASLALADEPAPDAGPDADPDVVEPDEAPAMDPAEAKAAARKLLDGGDAFLKKGDYFTRRKKAADAQAQYERALAAYQKAFELVPNPQILFPIAIALDKLGRTAEAARDYRRFLTQVAEPDPALKADAERRLEAAKLNVGVVSLVIVPDGTHVALSGTEIGVSPLADPLFLPAGDYTLSFTADGYQPLEQALTVETGSESERTFELNSIEIIVEPPRPPPPPKPEIIVPPAPSKVPLYIGGALTVGLLGGATAAGIMAIGRHGDFTSTDGTAQDREDARVSGRRLALVTDGLIAGTIVAAGVLSFYYVKVYRPKARVHGERARQRRETFDEYAIAPKVRLAPWVQAGGGGLVVAGDL